MGGGEHDQGFRHRHAHGGGKPDSGVRVRHIARAAVNVPDRRQGVLRIDGRGQKSAVVRAGQPRFSIRLKIRHERLERLYVAIEMIVKEPLEVAGHLNVHGRRGGAAHLPTPVKAGGEELRQDVVFVGGDDEALDGEAHALGDVAGEDVTEIARGHAKGRRRRWAAALRLIAVQAGVGVIENLRQHPRPVHRVHRPKAVAALEFQIAEDALHQGLAVVKAAVNGQAMDVGVRHGGHLQFLQAADAALGVQDEDVDVGLAAHPGDGGAAGVAAGGAENVEAGAAPLQDVGEQAAKKLQGDVLESQRRAVEQLQDFHLSHRPLAHHAGAVEAGVGGVHQVF